MVVWVMVRNGVVCGGMDVGVNDGMDSVVGGVVDGVVYHGMDDGVSFDDQ